jgi:hypothetical protein
MPQPARKLGVSIHCSAGPYWEWLQLALPEVALDAMALLQLPCFFLPQPGKSHYTMHQLERASECDISVHVG